MMSTPITGTPIRTITRDSAPHLSRGPTLRLAGCRAVSMEGGS
jgi:hypothetical protein